MEQLKSFFNSLANSGAELDLDEIFIIVFVSLVILALLLGYLLGRKVTDKSNPNKVAKKTEKANKKAEKQAAKQAKKLEKENIKDDWFDADNNDDDVPSSMPIIPERKTTTFIDIDKKQDDVPSAPVVKRKQAKEDRKESKANVNRKNDDLKAQAKAAEDERQAEKLRQESIDHEEQRAAAVAAALKSKAEDIPDDNIEEQPKLSKKEQKRLEKEQAKAAKAAEPKLSKKEQKKLKKAEEEGLANTVIVEADTTDSTVTAEEMAKRLESIMGTTPAGTVSLGAAEEEEVPADKIGTIEATQIPGRHNDNWVLEETKRQNEEADKKDAERKEKETLPFAFGSDIEASADDVQLSYKARKKLREEEAKKAQEEEQKKERKHITSIFAKKQEEETVSEQEEEYFDENYMGEEIPDSLAGFGFSAAPKLNTDEEKSEE